MKEKTWKRILLGVVFLVLVFAVMGVRSFEDSKTGQLTGTQYLMVQEKYMAEFAVYADEIDNVISLYLNDSISAEDFTNHIAIFQSELNLMYTTQQAEKAAHPVETGTHTYHTKKGCEAVEECYSIFQNILTMMGNNYQDKDALSYKYIAYHQDVIGAVADYATAKEFVFGEENTEDE